MTIDGVIQNEENEGDGFKYGGWFFPYADEVTGAVVQERERDHNRKLRTRR